VHEIGNGKNSIDDYNIKQCQLIFSKLSSDWLLIAELGQAYRLDRVSAVWHDLATLPLRLT